MVFVTPDSLFVPADKRLTERETGTKWWARAISSEEITYRGIVST